MNWDWLHGGTPEHIVQALSAPAGASLNGWRSLLANLSNMKLAVVLALFFTGLGAFGDDVLDRFDDQSDQVQAARRAANMALDSVRQYRRNLRARLTRHEDEYADLEGKVDAALSLLANQACLDAGNPPAACNQEAIRRILRSYGIQQRGPP